jgi:DNA-binding beta-propeller fold protein YncE
VADAPPAPTGIPALGGGRHDRAAVRVAVVASREDGLNTPRDLAFNPEAPEQLWVVNFASNRMTIVRCPGTPERDAVTRGGPGNQHFLARPSTLAFGAPGSLATAHETDRATQPTTPPDFMGPTLWDSDYDGFNGGDAAHIDMLHNSPNAVGIAWERDNVYWVLDGAHRSLTRYDFARPHERGGVDHSGGIVRRFAEGMFSYAPGVSSHAEFDREAGRLYFADTGANRVAVFDPGGATVGARIAPNYDATTQTRMTGGALETFIDGAAAELRRPSGLALVGDVFYVTDNETSRVTAFNRQGRRLDWLDLASEVPAGGLMGIAVDARGWIYLTDAVNHRVLEVAPP